MTASSSVHAAQHQMHLTILAVLFIHQVEALGLELGAGGVVGVALQ